MTEAERKKVIEIYGLDYSELDIPTFIRERDAENEARALDWLEEEGIQEKRETKEKEKYDQI